MTRRRFTRLTNGFSKAFEKLCYAVALDAMHDNYVKVHPSLRFTPAMESVLADNV